VTISDKWKAVVAALGALALTFQNAIEDGNISLNETGLIVGAAVALGVAVWAVRNKPAAA